MIHSKYQKFVFSFLMALIMSCIMSFVITAFNVGLTSDILHMWFKAWSFAFVIALPTITVVAPVAQALTGALITKR